MEKGQNEYHPPVSNGYNRADAEAAATASEEHRRQKKKKLIKYIVAFVIFQTLVIVVMSLTVMKIRTPKYRLRSVKFETSNPGNGSFNILIDARLRVKNMNFGTFKYQPSSITFLYNEAVVGTADVPKSKAGWLSSKKFNVPVTLSSSTIQGNPNLQTDLNSKLLPLTVKSTLTGKVTLTFIFKKKKSTNMNCKFNLDLQSEQIRDVKC